MTFQHISTKYKFYLSGVSYCSFTSILFFCLFLIGAIPVKANASWPGEAQYYQLYYVSEQQSMEPPCSYNAIETFILGATGIPESGAWLTKQCTIYPGYGVQIRTYYCENDIWRIFTYTATNKPVVYLPSFIDGTSVPTGPCPCNEADKAQKIAACGGEDYAIWVENTCTAICHCIGQNEEKREEAILRCEPYGGLLSYSLEECRGECYPDPVCPE